MALAEPREHMDAAGGPALEALVEKYRGRRFEELLGDPRLHAVEPLGSSGARRRIPPSDKASAGGRLNARLQRRGG